MKYTNHFAEQPENYLLFRPDYPKELFDYLAGLVATHALAWDCGAGNGQSAVRLANYFTEVIATDVNQAQLDAAPKKNNIRYYHWPAEKTGIAAGVVDLTTVSQALHWFDLPQFYGEVRRISKPDGIIAAWCYSLGQLTPAVDLVVRKLYAEILGDAYWPKERHYIDNEYRDIAFPFQKLVTPQFSSEKNYTFAQFIGYLNTWSAVKEYQMRNQRDPLALVYADLQAAWGDVERMRVMHWPLHLLVGHV